jgi:hypothetical protein
MGGVIQFPSVARCKRCGSRSTVATLLVVDGEKEEEVYFCETHSSEVLSASALSRPLSARGDK